jgi:hypothetical protein
MMEKTLEGLGFDRAEFVGSTKSSGLVWHIFAAPHHTQANFWIAVARNVKSPVEQKIPYELPAADYGNYWFRNGKTRHEAVDNLIENFSTYSGSDGIVPTLTRAQR